MSLSHASLSLSRYLLLAALLLLSCQENSGIISDPAPPARGTLETVTWNIWWYGSASKGPADEALQTDNIMQVMDSLDADLYAIQEVTGRKALDRLLQRKSGYNGFVGSNISAPRKTAFLYRRSVIDSLSSGLITAGQDAYDWADGRFPLYFSFTYSRGEQTVPIYAVVIHATANSGQESYLRRKRAAESLHTYLEKQKPDANIILLGDYNDDVDVSIYDGTSPSPYQPFVADSTSFRVVTAPLSRQDSSTWVGPDYTTEVIDHITVSDELLPAYEAGSASIYFRAQEFIPDFYPSTSDHLPVQARFDIERIAGAK